ncbi:hypothetical protein BDV59DRAFT_179669 [Aspergillus ambiguus]|uniref:ubiquitin domain-containing protein DSK2 n=1 Tax=Aspergillus ambiguus TaxID=176160 RepID=UPI003CCCF87D
MADATGAEETSITFNVKSSNDAKFTLTLPASTPVSELKEKLATSEYADTPAQRQRLIYSGRVLKDNETLSTYNIKDGHTIHLVKSAASNQQPGSSSQSAATSASSGAAATPPGAGVPTNLAAGTGNNPLAGLTGARYAGFAQLPGAGMFGPDGGMGPPPDAEQMISMLENPQFQSTINEALQNPAMIEMMIQQNPMLRDTPGARQMLQSPAFRQMMTDPVAIRRSLELQRAMGGLGGGSQSAFPAPGVTNTTPQENRGDQTGNNNSGASPTPGGQMFNPFMPQGMGAGNPFAALFGGNPAMGANAGAGTGNEQAGANQGATGGSTTAEGQGQNQANAANPFASLFGQGGMNPFDPQTNPFLQNPELAARAAQEMASHFGMGNGQGGGANLASLLGLANPPVQDNRPPEERYAEQLRQLNDMGFYEFERNIEALRRTGGSVQGAVEYLLGNPA